METLAPHYLTVQCWQRTHHLFGIRHLCMMYDTLLKHTISLSLFPQMSTPYPSILSFISKVAGCTRSRVCDLGVLPTRAFYFGPIDVLRHSLLHCLRLYSSLSLLHPCLNLFRVQFMDFNQMESVMTSPVEAVFASAGAILDGTAENNPAVNVVLVALEVVEVLKPDVGRTIWYGAGVAGF